MNYKKLLQDPRWKATARRIKKRDKCCQFCGNTRRLEAHHLYYDNDKKPWEYEDEFIIALCHDCHDNETKDIKEIRDTINEALKSGLKAREIKSKINLHFKT
jgi:5-methylcytosine-specific restriction endonuclease McrA